MNEEGRGSDIQMDVLWDILDGFVFKSRLIYDTTTCQ